MEQQPLTIVGDVQKNPILRFCQFEEASFSVWNGFFRWNVCVPI
jgi:hypothetical protein